MNLQRQEGIVSSIQLEHTQVIIVGAGSIGSFVTLALAKMGIKNITVKDFDRVEEHNIPNQLFKIDSVGQLKAEALTTVICELTGTKIYRSTSRFSPSAPAFGSTQFTADTILIAAVDSMRVRKELLEFAQKKGITRFIDTRMGKLAINIYNFNPQDAKQVKMYLKTWFPDEKAAKIPCTQRGIVYPVMTCASVVTDLVKRYATDDITNFHYLIDYGIPFFMVE